MNLTGFLLSFCSLLIALWFGWQTRKRGLEWLIVVGLGLVWVAGASFYFYEAIAGMTNPPMQWGYPRTVEGFIHAFTRGQYEKTNPTDIFGDPMRFIGQLGRLGAGIIEEFNWVYAFLALVPFVFFRKLHRRERAWLIGITAIYLCLGVLLLILLNPPPDRQAQGLVPAVPQRGSIRSRTRCLHCACGGSRPQTARRSEGPTLPTRRGRACDRRSSVGRSRRS